MKKIIACCLLWGSVLTAKAQQTPFVLGVTDQVVSRQLNETRTLNIYLPEGYQKDTATYPVIYLLDGSANEDFVHVTGLVQFLTMIRFMPPTIIVGIANVDRKRDFTFPTSIAEDKKAYPTTGGSAKFIDFLEKDLQPYIQQHYRVKPHRTLVGQSLGGLIGTEVLLHRPELFEQYVIISPSLWWDNESLLTAAPALLRKNLRKPVNVYLSVGEEGDVMKKDAARLAALLEAAKPQPVTLYYVPFPAENHLTILHRSLYAGLDSLFHKMVPVVKP
ncbi:alpha/beta hydrolase [Chitinophaga qingshengii]|uniref:Alpha/beta hydrolase n=1 Tax=Chitinophaga qingshengii TaxID=1569794 RepID=A0ABR7TUX1_9BACT|nr:alpha/beta hydrolase-fold protein [Chitinophaga qingshengii]MBC9934232.1 alpha/beta hydrolase [Chitinophaga qingshengii]